VTYCGNDSVIASCAVNQVFGNVFGLICWIAMLLKAVGHALEGGRTWLSNLGTICSMMTHELDHKDPTHLS